MIDYIIYYIIPLMMIKYNLSVLQLCKFVCEIGFLID